MYSSHMFKSLSDLHNFSLTKCPNIRFEDNVTDTVNPFLNTYIG